MTTGLLLALLFTQCGLSWEIPLFADCPTVEFGLIDRVEPVTTYQPARPKAPVSRETGEDTSWSLAAKIPGAVPKQKPRLLCYTHAA
jgi:hypothetical protein